LICGRSGLVQVVYNPEVSKDSHTIASDVRSEYVLQVNGKVSHRLPGTENPKMSPVILKWWWSRPKS